MRMVEGLLVPEFCPVDELPESVLSHWDVEFLCSLHECPGCELTPDHPFMLGMTVEEAAEDERRRMEDYGSPADAEIPF